MSDSFWNKHSVHSADPNAGISGQDTTKSKPAPRTRGEAARMAQVEEAKKDQAPAREAQETMPGALGSMDARRRVRIAQRALKRQQQHAEGKYPSGE